MILITILVAVSFLPESEGPETNIVAGRDYPAGNGPASAGNSTASAGDSAGDEAEVEAATSEVIVEFFPINEASACSEPVGVQVTPGHGALLTINGQRMAPDQLNVNLDATGNMTDVPTASRTTGHYTYQPEADCPHGSVIRTTQNVLEVCVYRLGDNSQTCIATRQHVFDAV